MRKAFQASFQPEEATVLCEEETNDPGTLEEEEEEEEIWQDLTTEDQHAVIAVRYTSQAILHSQPPP
ncbi:hypothetical protein CesoFtcFv8_004590 [Champsocephalus esox]|uniref:Uncharacterized protein n=1 Tax=Champsocephalus esox TaxID=159716 RepID=A0AAN8CNG0_9TELE|nr:hypothetical protein CesoFtcFv8_004590 [Champsocephalus esox]